MTVHRTERLLPSGLRVIFWVFEGQVPPVEPGFRRVVLGVNWCVDEELFRGAL